MAWERQVFGAICFAVYDQSIEAGVTFEDIALDFFGTEKGDVVASATQTWLNELLHGCSAANLFIADVLSELKYDAKKQSNTKTSKCRFRGYQSTDNVRY